MTPNELALRWATHQIGRHEIPDGSNSGPFVRLCQRATWLPGSRWPWCVAFYIAAWAHGAKVKLWWRGAGAYAFLNAARKGGRAIDLRLAVPGDAVILNIGAGHCAMLAEPWDGGRLVHTIDGNWGNAVERVSHPANQVRGCIRPIPTRDPIVKPRPARPRMFEVATSASGHRKIVYVSGRKAVAHKLARILARFPRVTIEPRGATP